MHVWPKSTLLPNIIAEEPVVAQRVCVLLL